LEPRGSSCGFAKTTVVALATIDPASAMAITRVSLKVLISVSTDRAFEIFFAS
jgi:hypothetical protein